MADDMFRFQSSKEKFDRRIKSLIDIPPPDMTWDFALFVLYAIQQWEVAAQHSAQRPTGGSYAAGYFYNQTMSCINGLENFGSRTTTMKHLATSECVVCKKPIDLARTVGDHIIARKFGGPEHPANMIHLCRPHNSSKGTKDLIEWWMSKDFPPIPRNILCLYARVYWAMRDALKIRDQPAPIFLHHFIASRVETLSDAHRQALYGSAYMALGFLRWEQLNGTERF